jgi:hypothetical protein
MSAFVSLEGIKYQCNRLLKNTAYDQQDKSKKQKRKTTRDESDQDIVSTKNPKKFISKTIVNSLEVNVVSDLPTPAGVRYVYQCILFFVSCA